MSLRVESHETTHVVVVGGGLAGLAAATALAARGVKVTVLESRPRLGGRASSIVDRETGQTIDNCQHVAMGCCTNFFHWCETIGCRDLFERQERLFFVGPPRSSGRPTIARFEATSWPAPLHLAAALKGFDWLSFRDRQLMQVAIGNLIASKFNSQDESVASWLARQGQSENLVESYWKPVLISALSDTLDRLSLKYARKVLVDGFVKHRAGWEVWIPKVPLDELYGTRLQSWMLAHGVDLRLNAGVARITSNGGELQAKHRTRRDSSQLWSESSADDRATDDALFTEEALRIGLMRARSVELRSGEQIPADHIIVAVPQHLVGGLVPDELQSHQQVQRLSDIQTAPIASVHLWLDRAIMDLPHAVLINRLSQWIFARGHSERGFYYQIVVSAAFDLAKMTEAEVLDRVMNELREVWERATDAKLQHGRLITEHKAVFSPRPNIDELRPQAQSALRNLHFAGDWTSTGWPSTMEGAVRSGYLAAESVLKQLGHATRIVQPDLPGNWVTRWLG